MGIIYNGNFTAASATVHQRSRRRPQPYAFFFQGSGSRGRIRIPDEEQIILAMTEEITLISRQGLTENTYARAKELFSEKQFAEIIMAVITIHAWNRIVVSTHLRVPKDYYL